ncbi:hypothetical protein ACEWY4_015260 [Coilia grayii]|uniref:Zona pellucida sperm-binding protein 3 n=1 Tax=Coilia grayii TaxID=363190 RepID=A0ABD1JMI5_9TELE
MGAGYWLSVTLVLYNIILQTDAKRPPWFPRTSDRNGLGLSDRSAFNLPEKDDVVEFHAESLQKWQNPAQQPVQSKQKLQGSTKQMVWRFPTMPAKPAEPDVPFVPKEAEPADSVAVRCGEADVQVEVKQDFFRTGQLIQPEHVSLGDCPVTREDSYDQVLIFESELHRCGSKMEMTEDELVYTFSLVYQPNAVDGSPILRTNGATLDIVCRYPRTHNVSSDGLKPTWVPLVATKTADEVLVFNLRLMTDDWKFERASNIYYLGNMLHIEASVVQSNHMILRVFVHSCVATAVPNVNSSPRYSLIENHGCLVDAKLTGSRSQFLPRAEDNRLKFELEAFRFAQGDGQSIYITCQLVATTALAKTDHRACSYSVDR